MTMADLHERSLLEVAGMLDRGEVTSVELTEASLARIESLDGDLNCFITVDRDGALAAAQRADAERAAGLPDRSPLHGVPVAVKDNLDTAGLRTTQNSRALADHVPTADTPAAARLRAAGAVIVGKTNLNEFGWSLPSEADLVPPVNNPWQPEYRSIGSSSGSAAAVSAGMVYAALGTDGGGSTRLPAGQHGQVGLKPGWGSVPRGRAYHQLSVVGVLARSADDAAAVYDAIADRPVGPLDANPLAGLRLGIPRQIVEDSGLEDDVSAAFDDTIRELEGLGAVVSDVELPAMTTARAATFTLIAAGSFTTREALLRDKLDLIGPITRKYVLTGAFARATDVLRAQRVAELAESAMTADLGDLDGVLSPVSPVVTAEAARVPGEHRKGRNAVFTAPFNLIGWPAIAIPCGMGGVGLPIGFQVAGCRRSEPMLLNLAKAYGDSTGHQHRLARSDPQPCDLSSELAAQADRERS
jgi:aspartyl-tRNA(Asn)/glutamyl-tRNA(Gln) amidotransferase subunit A